MDCVGQFLAVSINIQTTTVNLGIYAHSTTRRQREQYGRASSSRPRPSTAHHHRSILYRFRLAVSDFSFSMWSVDGAAATSVCTPCLLFGWVATASGEENIYYSTIYTDIAVRQNRIGDKSHCWEHGF